MCVTLSTVTHFVSCNLFSLISTTLDAQHLYRHPQRLAELQQAATAGHAVVDQEKAREEFFTFYEDLYMEFSKFGRVEALHVCDNLGTQSSPRHSRRLRSQHKITIDEYFHLHNVALLLLQGTI